MSRASLQDVVVDGPAKQAVSALFGRFAPLVETDEMARASLMDARDMLSQDHSDAVWEKVASVLHLHLVKTGIAFIGDLGLMPRRARVSLGEASEAVLAALETGTADARGAAQRCARVSGQAFFSWALSGVGALPAIASYVVGLPANAAAERVKASAEVARGPAMRAQRIAEINAATRKARERAAQALVVDLVGMTHDTLRAGGELAR